MSNDTCLWMGDLEMYMTERFICQAFEQMGETIVKVKLISSKQSRNPAGYCFVEFSSTEAAQRAMLRLNGKVIPGSAPPKRFKLNRACFGREHLVVPEYSLFVGDISEEIDDYNLFTIFSSQYTSCKGAKVVLDASGKSRGYGFVRFTDETEQQRALTEMNGFTAGNCGKPLRVSLATPKRLSGTGPSGTDATVAPNSFYQCQFYPNYQPYYSGTDSSYTGWSQMDFQQQDIAAAAAAAATGYYYGPTYSETSYGYYPQQSTTEAAQFQSTLTMEPTDGDDDETLEEPNTTVDISQYNFEFMEQSEELYLSLEASRWHQLDIWQPVCMASTVN